MSSKKSLNSQSNVQDEEPASAGFSPSFCSTWVLKGYHKNGLDDPIILSEVPYRAVNKPNGERWRGVTQIACKKLFEIAVENGYDIRDYDFFIRYQESPQ